MQIPIRLQRLVMTASLSAVLAACGGLGGTPDPINIAPPPASEVPPTEAQPTPEPTTPPTLAPTEEPPPTEPPPTDAPDPTIVPIEWYKGLVPPLTKAELCGLLTPEEITAIQGWTWELTELGSFPGCAYAPRELHTGALVRFGNSPLIEEEFRAIYPDAMDLDGILLGDAYGRGRLDDIWIEMTGLDNLRLEIFATPLTEAQSLQLVEAVYPNQ